MGADTEGITANHDGETLSHDERVLKQLDHIDTMVHELQQAVATILADVEAARPMLEKWQHSAIRKLATGQMPWSTP
jgi:hypothetical protein